MQQTIRPRVNEKVYEFLAQTKKRINILFGGADSGKSWGIGQFLLLEKFFGEQGIGILVTRATRPELKKSCWMLINDLISKYDLPGVKANLSDLTLTTNGNSMFFMPLDDVMKLKSFERINYVWGEEATEFSYKDYLQLNLRCRATNPGGMNQLFYSFNPVDDLSFWVDIVQNPPEDVGVNHSTVGDNAFADPEDRKQLDKLKDQDVPYYKIYRLGEWASPTSVIYTNWDIVGEWPDGDWFDEIIYGVDFAYHTPTAVVEIGIKDEKEVWERELLYETHLKGNDLVERLNELVENKNREMYVDAADPRLKDEIGDAGFNVFASVKGKNSVKDGIDFVKRFKRHVLSTSVNWIKEVRGYKNKEDRNGNVLEEPVKFRDHLMDAERYALYTHLANRREAAVY